jgi:lipoic acid synthetase
VAIGQYLRPTIKHLPVESYIHPTEFQALEEIATRIGFGWVKAGPMVRSSYHADD